MYNERDWRKSRTTRRTGKENEFYAKPNNGDIIEPKESRPPSISQIKDGIKAAETNLDNMQRQQWNTIISGATDDQVIKAQSRVDSAKEELKKYNLQLTTAYGLDDDGYWNKPQTARSTQMNANPEHAYAIGNSTNAASKPISADTRSAKPANTPPKTTARSMQMKANPEHAYAIGNSTTAASKPISAYSRGTKPATAQPMKTRTDTPGKTVKTVSTTQHDMEIAQLQDELVNTPMLSEQKKWKIEDEITKLTAERDVINWKNSHPAAPTVENYETQMRYFDDLWNQNQDALVNGLGNDTVKQGSDEWYALLKKGDDILEQRNAYNKGMMGLLDGQKAVTAQESAATQTGGGTRSVSLDAKDEAVYTGQTKPGMDDEESTGVTDSYYDGMMHAYGNYKPDLGGDSWGGQTDAPDAITPYPWSQTGNANTESEKQTEKDAAIEELDAQMEEEIAAASGLKLDAYERGYTFFDEYINLKGMRQSMEGQILSSLGIDASNFTKAELREAFAQSTWVLDGAYDVSVDKLIADLETKYDGLKEDALGKIDNKYFVIERIGEIDENPDISFFDWEGSGLDVQESLDEYQGELAQLTTEHDELLEKYNTLPDDEKYAMRLVLDGLEVEMNNMETLKNDTSIALDYENDIKDLNLTQLVLRAQDMFYDQINALPNDSLSISLEGFDKAIELWKKGDDYAMKRIVEFVYGDEKGLDDIEDFNALREGYCYYNWQWMGETNARVDLLMQESSIIETIEPYFIEAANYQKTDVGFTIELPTNLYFAMDYAKRMESQYNIDGEAVDYGTIAGSAISSAIPVVGSVASIGISLLGKILSNHYGGKEDMFDDAIFMYDILASREPIKESTILLEWDEKDSDFDILGYSD